MIRYDFFHFKKIVLKKLFIALAVAVLSIFIFSLSCVYPVYDGDGRALEEQHSVWQYLSVFSIYQDRVPPEPGNLTPYDMFAIINDSLGNGRYTEYIDDRSSGGSMFNPHTVFHDPEKLTESTVYIRIPEFSEEALSFWREHVNFLAGFPNIVIDLRRNGGGLLRVSDEMISEFITRGTNFIGVRQRDYDTENLIGVTVDDKRSGISLNPRLLDKNISILMDGGSASASEIMAAALKDCVAEVNLVGTRTFGKGIGQAIFSRSGRKTLSVTFMEIFGLSDRTGYYHRIGIEPDPVNEEYMEEAAELLPADRYLYYAVKLLESDIPPESVDRMQEIAEANGFRKAKQEESEWGVIGAFVEIEEVF
jgi:hypothetical protein